MLCSFVMTLLFSGSLAAVESFESSRKPSTFRDALKRYSSERDELLQRTKQQFTQRFLAQTQSVDSNPRFLQAATSPPSSAPLCSADGGVNFNDDFDQTVFQGEFETTCACSYRTSPFHFLHIDFHTDMFILTLRHFL